MANQTKLLNFTDEHLKLAGELIRSGKLVAFPTETVYGLGANAFDEDAVKSTFTAKGRPSDNPLIVHIYAKSQVWEIARFVSDDAQKIIEQISDSNNCNLFYFGLSGAEKNNYSSTRENISTADYMRLKRQTAEKYI